MVDIGAFGDGGVIGQKLRGDGVDQRRGQAARRRQGQGGLGAIRRDGGTGGIGDQRDLTATGHDLLHVRDGLVEQRVMGGEDQHGQGAVDERDGAVLQFTRCISFGVYVAEFFEFQCRFECRGIHHAAPEEEGGFRFGQRCGDGGDLGLAGEGLAHLVGDMAQPVEFLPDLGGAERAALACRMQRQKSQHGQLVGIGLGRGDRDLDTGQDRQRHIAFARDGRGADIDEACHHRGPSAQVAKGGQRIGGLARLADDKRQRAGGHGRFAIAEFRGDIDLAGDASHLFEPVFRSQAGIIARAAGHHHHAVEAGEIKAFGENRQRAGRVAGQRLGQNAGLFMDLFGHEMLIARLVDDGGADLDPGLGAAGGGAGFIENLSARAGDEGNIALVEISDLVGHGGQRDGVRADIHLALSLAMADGQRRATARGDQQIIMPIEQETQRKSPLKPRDGGLGRFARGHAARHETRAEMGHGFGVGFAFEIGARKFGPQFAVILDDAVMDHGDGAVLVGVGIGLGRGAMGGPTGVPDARLARQGFMHQPVGEVDELAHGAAAGKMAILQRRDARAVIAAIFQPLERLEDQGGDLMAAQNADDTAHGLPFLAGLDGAQTFHQPDCQTGFVDLFGPPQRQRARRDILGDDRARSGHGLIAKADRGH